MSLGLLLGLKLKVKTLRLHLGGQTMTEISKCAHALMVEDSEFDRRATAAVQTWAAQHPDPDVPAVVSLNGRTYSPRQLAREVDRRSRIGEQHLRAMRVQAITGSLGVEGVLEQYLKGNSEWRLQTEAAAALGQRRAGIGMLPFGTELGWLRGSAAAAVASSVELAHRAMDIATTLAPTSMFKTIVTIVHRIFPGG